MKLDNELMTLEEVEKHINGETAAMVYFYNDNCAPCHSLRPKVIELVKNDFPKMKLAFVNTLKYPELPARYNVFANPTLITFFDGREYKRESKYISIPQLAEAISRPYDMIFEN
jgi:thiol-disulfide isomerase/thioredoxin